MKIKCLSLKNKTENKINWMLGVFLYLEGPGYIACTFILLQPSFLIKINLYLSAVLEKSSTPVKLSSIITVHYSKQKAQFPREK